MTNVEKVSQLSEKMDGFVYQEFTIILFILMVVAVVFLFSVSFNDDLMSKLIIPSVIIALVGVFSIVGLVTLGIEYAKMSSELTKAEAGAIAEISKTKEVTTVKIIKSKTTSEEYCPHVELKEEKCTYIEFLTDDKKTMQVFVAVDSPVYADADNPKVISYLDLTKKERKLLNEFMTDIESNKREKHNLYPKTWSLATSIE